MTHIKNQAGYENLYVILDNSNDKRKVILNNTAKILKLQKSIERIFKIREVKVKIIQDIKEMIFAISEDLQSFQRNLPNVRNIISFTEKEINTIEKNITVVEKKLDKDNEDLDKTMELIENIKKEGLVPETKVKKVIPQKEEEKEVINKKEDVPKEKKLSKLERIENNLKVISKKLRGL